jgi:hypothetical protein
MSLRLGGRVARWNKLSQPREVDFVAEDNQPPSDLHCGKNNTIWSLAVLAILLEGLQDELWRGSAGEVKTNNIHVGKLAQCAEESSSFQSPEDRRASGACALTTKSTTLLRGEQCPS